MKHMPPHIKFCIAIKEHISNTLGTPMIVMKHMPPQYKWCIARTMPRGSQIRLLMVV
jgi:hypothetical protein